MLMTKNLEIALKEMRDKCIGLYFNPFTKQHEAVVEETDYTFIVITISNLFGLQSHYYSKHDDLHFPKKIIYFPEKQTLTEMIEDPKEFDKWCQKNL